MINNSSETKGTLQKSNMEMGNLLEMGSFYWENHRTKSRIFQQAMLNDSVAGAVVVKFLAWTDLKSSIGAWGSQVVEIEQGRLRFVDALTGKTITTCMAIFLLVLSREFSGMIHNHYQ